MKKRKELTQEDIRKIESLVNELELMLPFDTIRDKQEPLRIDGMVGLIMLLFRNLPKEFRVSTANLMYEHYGDLSP